MRRKITVLFLLALLLSLPARADMGPKPSVRISLPGLPEEPCYGTLLSLRPSIGPASAWDGRSEYSHYAYGEEGRDIWEKFVQYQDSDGYYFLQEWWDCAESGRLDWTYYPPSPFKILLYFPESDRFCVSPIYERYAFDSYFTADLSQLEAGRLTARPSYDYTWETVSLLARILLTIAVELAIALPFGYRGRSLAFIAAVNAVTQIGLNVALNLINYYSGPMSFAFSIVPLELAVFLAEGIVYAAVLARRFPRPRARRRAVLYALAANAASFALGLAAARLIPGIF